jgi:hypothetical protein
MAMSAAINSKPMAMGSTRKGIFWDDEDDEDEEDDGDSPGLEEGDLQLDFPGDADRPIATSLGVQTLPRRCDFSPSRFAPRCTLSSSTACTCVAWMVTVT